MKPISIMVETRPGSALGFLDLETTTLCYSPPLPPPILNENVNGPVLLASSPLLLPDNPDGNALDEVGFGRLPEKMLPLGPTFEDYGGCLAPGLLSLCD